MQVVGVDGGGTRTRAVLLDESGRIARWAASGGSNFQMVGLDGLRRRLGEVLRELGLGSASAEVAMCLGLAGAGRADEQHEIADMVAGEGWAARLRVVTDARAALEGAHAGGPGLIVIAGTGSIVLGKSAGDVEARAGGWGPLLGDDGSGYRIGLEALRAAYRARDGWGEPTLLDGVLRQHLGIDSWDQAVRRVYGGDLDREHISGLAPLVFRCARQDDPVAIGIVAAAGGGLGRQVGAVAGRLLLTEVDVACAGGVFHQVAALWPFLEAAARQTNGVRLVRRTESRLPPVLGAALLAWQDVGRRVDEDWVDRLAREAPDFP